MLLSRSASSAVKEKKQAFKTDGHLAGRRRRAASKCDAFTVFFLSAMHLLGLASGCYSGTWDCSGNWEGNAWRNFYKNGEISDQHYHPITTGTMTITGPTTEDCYYSSSCSNGASLQYYDDVNNNGWIDITSNPSATWGFISSFTTSGTAAAAGVLTISHTTWSTEQIIKFRIYKWDSGNSGGNTHSWEFDLYIYPAC